MTSSERPAAATMVAEATEGASMAAGLRRSVDRLAESRARLLLDVQPDGTRRVVAERPGHEPRYRYLAGGLATLEKLLVRLLSAWGDGYGSALLFELWGSDAMRYGEAVSRLRGAALAGPNGKGADDLILVVADAMRPEQTAAKDARADAS